LIEDGFEASRIIHGQIGKNFTVDFQCAGVELAHELAVANSVQTASGIDTHDPQGAEFALFRATIAVGIG
jgi:mannose/fructose/N-acetylgalactosamine-specific phosphotransferase system component IIB